MGLDDILDFFVNLNNLSSKPEKKARNHIFKNLVAPGLIFGSIVFCILESEFIAQLASPIWFYVIFIFGGIVLAVLLTFLFLVTRLLTDLNMSIAAVMLLTGIGFSIAFGSYFNRIKDTEPGHSAAIETRWFEYAD